RLDGRGGPGVSKELIGAGDNNADPPVAVRNQKTGVTPAHADPRVPLLMMFGGRPGPPPLIEQFIADGWGYATINPASIQADNGAGLTSGIIGLVNHGQRRRPDDWGTLRAWAWGASRGLDYLETDAGVDATRVG